MRTPLPVSVVMWSKFRCTYWHFVVHAQYGTHRSRPQGILAQSCLAGEQILCKKKPCHVMALPMESKFVIIIYFFFRISFVKYRLHGLHVMNDDVHIDCKSFRSVRLIFITKLTIVSEVTQLIFSELVGTYFQSSLVRAPPNSVHLI